MTEQTSPQEDEYSKATRAVVDDTMRTDILGPNVLRILQDYKPANDLVQSIVLDAIQNNTEVKTAVDVVVENNEDRKRNKWIFGLGSAVAGIVITVIAGLIVEALKK